MIDLITSMSTRKFNVLRGKYPALFQDYDLGVNAQKYDGKWHLSHFPRLFHADPQQAVETLKNYAPALREIFGSYRVPTVAEVTHEIRVLHAQAKANEAWVRREAKKVEHVIAMQTRETWLGRLAK